MSAAADMPDDLYFEVIGEALLAVCRAWRERYHEAHSAAFALAAKYGAPGIWPDLWGDVVALAPPDQTPDGWKHISMRGRERIVPRQGKPGDAARAEILALPKHPRHSEIATAIGYPGFYSYRTDGGGSGSGMMGYRLHPVQLGWAAHRFVIIATNAAKIVAGLREVHPGCTIVEGEWTPPDGLHRISKAVKDLIYAESAVADEGVAA